MMDIYGNLETLGEHLANRRAAEREYAARHNLAKQGKTQRASLLHRILRTQRTPTAATKVTYTPISTANV